MIYCARFKSGFSLIEVLLALVIIAISLTALLRATGQDLRYTYRLKDKTAEHWVAWQALNQVQAGIIKIKPGQAQTFQTELFNHQWYWRPTQKASGIAKVNKIIIAVSDKQSGPFRPLLTGYTLQ